MKMNVDEAIEFVNSKRRIIPNVGFCHQLRIYQNMGCTLTHIMDEYRVHTIKN